MHAGRRTLQLQLQDGGVVLSLSTPYSQSYTRQQTTVPSITAAEPFSIPYNSIRLDLTRSIENFFSCRMLYM